MSGTSRPVIGIFGAGKVGIVIARLALAAGYTVHIASSGNATDTANITRCFAPRAKPANSHDLQRLADVLILAVPLRRFRELPLSAIAGHIVIDAMNYWPPIDGTLPEFETNRHRAPSFATPCLRPPGSSRPSTTSATTSSKSFPASRGHPTASPSPSQATTPQR